MIQSRIIHLLPLLLLLLTLLLWPSLHLLPQSLPYNEKRWMQIAVLLSLGLALLLSRNLVIDVSQTLSRLPMLVKLIMTSIFLIGGLSSALAASPRHAFLELSLFALIGSLIIYTATLYANNPHRIKDGILAALIFSVAISFALFVSHLLSIMTGLLEPSYYSLFQGFSQPRFFNQWQGLILPIVMGAALFTRSLNTLQRRFLFVLVAYLWAGIFFSGGRGVLAAAIIAIFVSGLLFQQTRTLWWKRNLQIFLLGLIFYLFVTVAIYLTTGTVLLDGLGLSRIIEHTTTSGRTFIWESALTMFLQNPYLGVGPMHFSWDTFHTTLPAHPHNIAIQFLTEWGAIATVLLFAVFSYAFFKWIRFSQRLSHTDANQSLLLTALTASFITGSLHSLVSGVWVMPLSQLTFALIIGWMLGIHLRTLPQIQPNKFILAAISIGAGIISFAFIYGFYPEAKQLNAWLLTSFETIDRAAFYPRFWLQGFIVEP